VIVSLAEGGHLAWKPACCRKQPIKEAAGGQPVLQLLHGAPVCRIPWWIGGSAAGLASPSR